jgi:hypothetical protein
MKCITIFDKICQGKLREANDEHISNFVIHVEQMAFVKY